MKRRQFLSTAAGLGVGVAVTTSQAQAADLPEEKRLQVYKCVVCETIVEILEPDDPPIVHCGKPMELLEEQTAPAAENKHVPVIEKVDGGYKVSVGSSAHPMTEAHYIMWIDLLADSKVYRQFLSPGDAPEAIFLVEAEEVSAREHCNLHGLWKDA